MRTTLAGGTSSTPTSLARTTRPVVGHPVAGRAQAVAVEDGADDRPVGEGHGGRAVPRLHERGVVAVEGPPGRVHRAVVLPRLGDHHQHGVVDGPAAEVEQLQHLVERGRVAGSRGHHGEGPLQPRDEVGGAQGFAGPHPVPVAGQRVDLAVVGHVAVRVGQGPRREGVGREPRVDEGQPADQPLVGQVGVELGQLVGGQHPLVGDRPGRQGGEVAGLDLVLGPLAHHEGQPVDGQRRVARRSAGCRPRRPRTAGASTAGPPRRWSRASDGSTGSARQPRTSRPSSAAMLAHLLPGLGGLRRVAGQEGDAGGVAAAGGQGEVHHRAVEVVGDLDQDAGAVAGVLLAPGRAPVGQVLEGVDGLQHQGVRRPSLAGRPPGPPRRRRARSAGRRARRWEVAAPSPAGRRVTGTRSWRRGSRRRLWVHRSSSGRSRREVDLPARDDVGPCVVRQLYTVTGGVLHPPGDPSAGRPPWSRPRDGGRSMTP